jgi:hypothetical protein
MNKIYTSFNRQKWVDDPFEKGLRFESYIIELFNEKHFKLVNWRRSQKTNNPLALTDAFYPDLELIFAGARRYKFAVECKWRQNFVEGKINWASDRQICSYEDFEYTYHIPVFVAIGVGGEPSNPQKLFVTPLRNISNYTEVYESDLIPYKRNPARRFFYDTVQLQLF